MRFTKSTSTGFGVAVTAAIAIVMACSDSPVEPAVAGGTHQAAFDQVSAEKTKKLTGHFARVKSDGTLVDGTAESASRPSNGFFAVRFLEPIDGCAASATSTAFPGWDIALFRVSPQISVGFGETGVADPLSVTIRFSDPSTGTPSNTAFSLILVCP